MQKKNDSIACSVENCKYFQQQYCTLDQIQVGQHESPAKTVEGTDCQSFEARQ